MKDGVEVGASLPGSNTAHNINSLKEEKIHDYLNLNHRHSR